MCEPCTCPDCEAMISLAAWLWTDIWGADALHPTTADDQALSRIMDALDRHWRGTTEQSAAIRAVRAEMTIWQRPAALVN